MTNKLSPSYAKIVQRYVSPISLVTIAMINPAIEYALACDFASEQFYFFFEQQAI